MKRNELRVSKERLTMYDDTSKLYGHNNSYGEMRIPCLAYLDSTDLRNGSKLKENRPESLSPEL